MNLPALRPVAATGLLGLSILLMTALSHAAPAPGSTPERSTIDAQYTWDLTKMYAGPEAWDAHYRAVEGLIADFAKRKGTLGRSPAELLAALQLRDQLNVQVEKLYAYASMRHHEDMRESGPQAVLQRAQTLAVKYEEAAAWFQPELLQIPDATLRGWLQQDGLKVYTHFVDDLLRTRAHILSPREEELLAMSGKAAGAAGEAFSLLSNTELRRRTVKDPEGKDVEMTSASYLSAMYSKDRRYRKDAFLGLYDSYLDVQGTLAATLAGAMQRDWFYAKARQYPSSLARALDTENLPTGVYTNLLGAVGNRLSSLHRYVALKKKVLQLDRVHSYDLYVDLVDVPDVKYTFEQAAELVLGGMQPFGPDYTGIMQRAFTSRWIDVYENKGKMSGAYNMGTYLAPPYVLLNYKGTFDDVSTVAHELGHAMQSYFAKETQPPVYAGYPMFTAEVASTAAEIVFKQSMLDRTQDPKQRAFLINQMLEDMRATVFRQTQFAEFDLTAHTLAEKGDPMTAEVLRKIAREIYVRYYGPEFEIDPCLDAECLRVPHFYTNYYVYRYATSYCAAAAIARRMLKNEPGAVQDWMRFLKAGNSMYAIDMLKAAGVDMTTPKPINDAMDLFDQLLGQLETLLAASSTH